MCISICTHYGAPSAARGSAHPPMARGTRNAGPGNLDDVGAAHRLGPRSTNRAWSTNKKKNPESYLSDRRPERTGLSASLCASRRALFVKRGGANRPATDRESVELVGKQRRRESDARTCKRIQKWPAGQSTFSRVFWLEKKYTRVSPRGKVDRAFRRDGEIRGALFRATSYVPLRFAVLNTRLPAYRIFDSSQSGGSTRTRFIELLSNLARRVAQWYPRGVTISRDRARDGR